MQTTAIKNPKLLTEPCKRGIRSEISTLNLRIKIFLYCRLVAVYGYALQNAHSRPIVFKACRQLKL